MRRALQAASSLAAIVVIVAGLRADEPAFDSPITSAEHLRLFAPGLTAARAEEIFPHLQKAMTEFEINTPARQAAFLSQLAVETEQFRRLRERYDVSPNFQLSGSSRSPHTATGKTPEERQKDYFNYWYGNRPLLGNTNPDDGYTFRGMGFIQLTGRSNYEAADKDLKLEGKLVADPTLAATDLSIAARTAGWYWKGKGLNQLADGLATASEGEFRSIANRISRGVNRGNPNASDAANHERERLANLVRARNQLQTPAQSHTGLYAEVAQRLRNNLGVVLGSNGRGDLMGRLLQTNPFDSFGGVVLGNEPIADAKVSKATLAFLPGDAGVRLIVEAQGVDGAFASDTWSLTELWSAYHFLYPNAEMQQLGARRNDFGIVGILKNNLDSDGSWEYTLHPAIANTVLAQEAMRFDMVLSLKDPRLPALPAGWSTYRWHDERAVISLTDGRIRIAPSRGPQQTLLRCKLWDKDKGLSFDLDPVVRDLNSRFGSMQAIDRLARLVALLNWIDRDGQLYAMPDRVQPARSNLTNRYFMADLSYPGLTIVGGTLGPNDPRDPYLKESPSKVFRMHLDGGKRYIAEVRSDFDAFLTVKGPMGTVVASDDDSAGNLDPRVRFECADDGTYEFYVASIGRDVKGSFTLRIWEGEVGLGQSIFEFQSALKDSDPRDAIRTRSPARVFFVRLDEGVRYVFEMKSKQFDSFLRLEDPEGRQLAYDDDSGGDRNARLTYTASRTGRYRMVATSYEPAAGYFLLSVSRAR